MTKKELIQELNGIPDDAIVCIHAQFGDEKYEVNSLEYEEGEDYFDIEDEPQKGNIVVL